MRGINPKWSLTRPKICLFLLVALIMLIYDLRLEPTALSINLYNTFNHPIFYDYFSVRTRLGFAMHLWSFAVGKPALYWLAVNILLNFRLFWNKPAANTQTKLESHAQPQRD